MLRIFILLLSLLQLPLFSEQLLRLNATQEPVRLDPRRAADSYSHLFITMLFDGLVRDGKSGPELSLAKSFSLSSDEKTYTFHLREAYWSNGDPITAEDFERSWKSILDPTFHHASESFLFVLKNGESAKASRVPLSEVGVKAINQRTLQVELECKTPAFLEMLAIPLFFPAHATATSGPFELTKWRRQRDMTLIKSQRFWDASHTHLDKIDISFVASATTELQLFLRGEIDWAGAPFTPRVSLDAFAALRKQAILQEQNRLSLEVIYLSTVKPPLNHPKMRRALALAINRKVLTEQLLEGSATEALGFTAKLFPDGAKEEAARLFDEALAEMKLTRETLPEIVLAYGVDETRAKVVQVLQEQLQTVLGITVKLDRMEFPVLLNKLRALHFSMVLLNIPCYYIDPSFFLKRFTTKDCSYNFCSWENETFTKLLQEKKFAEAEILFFNEMPLIPLYFPKSMYVKNPKLEGVIFSPTGRVDFRHARMLKCPGPY